MQLFQLVTEFASILDHRVLATGAHFKPRARLGIVHRTRVRCRAQRFNVRRVMIIAISGPLNFAISLRTRAFNQFTVGQ